MTSQGAPYGRFRKALDPEGLAGGWQRADTQDVSCFDPWMRARVVWFVGVVGALPLSVLFWMAGGFAFCGTDTTEPGQVGDWACGNLVGPVAPWAAIAATPVMAHLVGGWIALRRREWRLFAFFLIVPPVVLVGGFLTLLALF